MVVWGLRKTAPGGRSPAGVPAGWMVRTGPVAVVAVPDADLPG